MQAFEENDPIGEETLKVISASKKFNEWMYNTIKPYCTSDVLEIGSGIGNISEYFLRDNFNITLSDIRDSYCTILQNKFTSNTNLKGVFNINLTDPSFDTKHQSLFNQYSTIFALNVVEHIEDDKLAIRNASKLLKKEGNLIILVPSYNFLYNQFDSELGHFRRYTKKSLVKIFDLNSHKILTKKYFNFIGILGWFVSGKLMKNKSIPKGQMNIYNLILPLSKIIDKILCNQFGLSTIVVSKKVV